MRASWAVVTLGRDCSWEKEAGRVYFEPVLGGFPSDVYCLMCTKIFSNTCFGSQKEETTKCSGIFN